MEKERDNSWNFKGCVYLEREVTHGIHLDFTPADIPAYDFGRKQVGKGWLNTGYHYIIHPDGTIEKGIPEKQYADPSIPGANECICILVMGVIPEAVDLWKRKVWPFAKDKLKLDLPLKE